MPLLDENTSPDKCEVPNAKRAPGFRQGRVSLKATRDCGPRVGCLELEAETNCGLMFLRIVAGNHDVTEAIAHVDRQVLRQINAHTGCETKGQAIVVAREA